MAVWERQRQQSRCKMPSFSSSLLDAICHSIDESNQQQQVDDHFVVNRRNNSALVEQEIESLRRAIMIEKWMENYGTKTTSSRHIPSNSGSSTDSSIFSSSETESSASKSTPRSSVFHTQKLKNVETTHTERHGKALPKCEGRFTRTKSRALKIYGDLKKVKEPISPGGRIASFLNSIFGPRSLKKNQGMEEWSPVRKSRSMNETTTCSLASRSCLSKNPSSKGNKSKRSVRFCPFTVIVDKDCRLPCGQNIIHDGEYLRHASVPTVGSQFIKKNLDGYPFYEEKSLRKHEFRDFYANESDLQLDDKSCSSSDLFELDNIGRVGFGTYEEELPVYGTTSFKMNRAIASGLV